MNSSHFVRSFVTALIIAIRCASSFATPDKDNIWKLSKISAAKEKGIVCSEGLRTVKNQPRADRGIIAAAWAQYISLRILQHRIGSTEVTFSEKILYEFSARAPPLILS